MHVLVFFFFRDLCILLLLGAGHGLSSILQMLLNFPEHFANRKDIEALIRQAVDYVLSCEMPNGNYPPVPGEVRDQEDELVDRKSVV